VRATLALVTTTIAIALTAPPAHAGTYDVWSCAGPSGEPLPANGWTRESMGGYLGSTCGRPNGALGGRLDEGAVPRGSFARWIFEAPDDTTIARVTMHRTVVPFGLSTIWGRAYLLYRDSPVIREGYGLDACVYLAGPCANSGDDRNPFSDANRFSASSLRAGRLIASAECGGQEATCPAQPIERAGRFTIYRAQIGLEDAFPPTFRSAPSGGLLDAAAPVGGKRAVWFDGVDRGGGLHAAEVVVDGVTVARSALGAEASCREPFRDPVPCPTAADGLIEVDSSLLENGRRNVQLALVDAAGNRTLSEPVAVLVHNDKDPNGTTASRAARLTARFRGGRHSVRRVAFRKTAMVTGRLADRAGTPIGGARLQVYARLDRLGAPERPVATVKTRPNGRYRWIAPRGPSRFIRVAYRTYGSDAADAASVEVKLAVRARIALHIKPRRVANRGRITFRGRLLGGPGKAGAQVTIEAVGRDVRSRVPVTTLRTDARGRFRFSYRFLRSFAPFTYRFRARLMRQPSYPYADGASRIVTVRIVR
jgi:hypothetical protein